jgi:NADH:ubiquinone oxidoreductase subunit K
VFALFLIAIAASEAAVALALVVLLYRHRPTLDANAWTGLRDE